MPATGPSLPRIVIAGLSGDAGKTLVALSILAALRRRGVTLAAFKKGPDYIDSAWLAWVAGTKPRNLDTHLMGFDAVRRSFLRNAVPRGLNLFEGNRGLFDGFDSRGTHSTAELAKALLAPVILVVSAEKITRTAAALVLGCQRLDPELRIAGVILNRVNGKRHESILRAAIEEVCGVPVLGAISKLAGALVPMRHLGLVTPEEHGNDSALAESLRVVAEVIDLGRVLAIAASAGPLENSRIDDTPDESRCDESARGTTYSGTSKWRHPERSEGSVVGGQDVPGGDRSGCCEQTADPSLGAKAAPAQNEAVNRASFDPKAAARLDGSAFQRSLAVGRRWNVPLPDGSGLKIGVVRDSAFSFYYMENLEHLEQSGVTVVFVSALTASALPPELDALYIGGGFPETHAALLAANKAFLDSLRCAAEAGLPIYAECGGLMLLSLLLSWRGANYKMAGVLPFAVEVCEKPQGHGYSELLVDTANPFFAPGAILRGHEFHYSKIAASGPPPATACVVKRGVGCGGGRDGVLVHNVWASYTHLHALATPEFVEGMIRAAWKRKGRR